MLGKNRQRQAKNDKQKNVGKNDRKLLKTSLFILLSTFDRGVLYQNQN